MIKKYLNFINERKISEQLNLFGEFSFITENEIEELFVDFIDEDIIPEISFTYTTKKSIEDNNTLDKVYLLIDDVVNDSVRISISNAFDEDVCDRFKSIVEYLEEDYDVYFYIDDEVKVDINDIVFDKDYNKIISNRVRDEYLDNSLKYDFQYIYIYLVYSRKEKTLTQKEIVKYYDLKDFIEDKEKIYFDLSFEDIVKLTVNNRSDYISYLTDDVDLDIDHYSDYKISLDEFTTHHLDNENTLNLYKQMVDEYNKEYGGDYLSENDIEINDIGNSEYEDLENELSNDLINTYTDWEAQDLYYSNVQATQDYFDNKLQKELGDDVSFNIYTKDYKKYYRFNLGNYLLKVHDEDYEDYEGSSISDLFTQYCENEVGSFDLNPSTSDYGNVNFKEFNVEAKSLIAFYIKNNEK